LDEALKAKPTVPINRCFVIGGASLYNKTLGHSAAAEVDWVLVTRITAPEFDCDTFMPEFRNTGKWKQESHDALVKWVGFDVPAGKQKHGDVEYEFQLWTRQDQV
jgi:dihydrofolate reductase